MRAGAPPTRQGRWTSLGSSPGGVAERLNAAVSKTVMGVFSSIEGSNPSPSVFRVRRVPRVHAPLAISLALLRP